MSLTPEQRREAALKAAATKRARAASIKVPDLVTNPVGTGQQVRDAVAASWPAPPDWFAHGELKTGRWAINPKDTTEAWGVCAVCGSARPASALRLTKVPFGKASDDYWACDPIECPGGAKSWR